MSNRKPWKPILSTTTKSSNPENSITLIAWSYKDHVEGLTWVNLNVSCSCSGLFSRASAPFFLNDSTIRRAHQSFGIRKSSLNSEVSDAWPFFRWQNGVLTSHGTLGNGPDIFGGLFSIIKMVVILWQNLLSCYSLKVKKICFFCW